MTLARMPVLFIGHGSPMNAIPAATIALRAASKSSTTSPTTGPSPKKS